MGSEGPPGTTIHITGFKKFHGVSENPAEKIVSRLKDYANQGEGSGLALPNGVSLGRCSVIETAGVGAVEALYALLNSALPDEGLLSHSSPVCERIIWLHLGVNAGARKFAIECQAVNEATFLYPDEMGWQPQKTPIFPEDGSISHTIQTSLPVNEIVQALTKKGHDVAPSNDAGRFVCNYVYYHSLRHAAKRGFKSLFVHVPLFTKINEETQMQFVAALLQALASIS